jgi:hypothetical protein
MTYHYRPSNTQILFRNFLQKAKQNWGFMNCITYLPFNLMTTKVALDMWHGHTQVQVLYEILYTSQQSQTWRRLAIYMTNLTQIKHVCLY